MILDMAVGKIHPTKHSGDLMVVGYTDSTNILVRFMNTGNERVARAHHIREGSVLDSKELGPASLDVGTVHPTTKYGDVVVLEYHGMKNVVVRFSCGTVKSVRASALRRGYVTPD